MSTFWHGYACFVVGLTGYVLFADGCSAPQTAANLAETAYLAEQIRCVDKSRTLEESKACRNAVKLAWAKDSGAE